jgi:hypothetical protein
MCDLVLSSFQLYIDIDLFYKEQYISYLCLQGRRPPNRMKAPQVELDNALRHKRGIGDVAYY